MTIYRCGECGLESSDKDIVDKCIRDHTKLKLDRIEQRIAPPLKMEPEGLMSFETRLVLSILMLQRI